MSDTDRIEKEIVVKATRARVWRALTDVSEFNRWFGVEMDDAFAPGKRARGRVTYPGYEHIPMDVRRGADGARVACCRSAGTRARPRRATATPTSERTLVVFELSDAPGGTRVRVVETGFDRIPAARRAEAFRLNDEGWAGADGEHQEACRTGGVTRGPWWSRSRPPHPSSRRSATRRGCACSRAWARAERSRSRG